MTDRPGTTRPTGHGVDGDPATSSSASIRGSSGMLVGYAASQLINFVAQVLIVRHLSKEAFGAFAWALSVVLLLEAVVPLGLDRASSRFLAVYDERRQYDKLFGLIFLVVAVLTVTGSMVVAAASALRPLLEGSAPSTLAVELLVVLAVLAPVQALDTIVVDAFAVFARPWTVFVRRYILQPVSRLIVVVLMMVLHEGVMFLTVGFLVTGVAGLVLFVALLWKLFRRIGLHEHFSWRRIRFPVREVAFFCAPLLLGSFVAIATTDFPAVALGRFSDDVDVAVFRAVLPFSVLNLGVLFTFSTLFTPVASRLTARGAVPEVRDLYWRNATWITVLTFPVLAMTTAFAEQFTVGTLGDRYASSAPILMILSCALYVNAMSGFNGLTVQLLHRSGWVLVANLLTLAFMVPVTSLLAYRDGARGAALAVLGTILVHNVLKQLGLGFGGGVGVADAHHAIVVAGVGALTGALFAVEALAEPPLWLCFPITAIAWLLLLASTRRVLRLQEVFPEVLRFPVTRWLASDRTGGSRSDV